MKNLILITGLFFLFQFKSYSQKQIGSMESSSIVATQLLLANQFEKVNSNIVVNNGVYIQQIGNLNAANTAIQASNSLVSLYQHGFNNIIDISREAVSVQQNILQKGNNNTIIDFGGYTNSAVSLEFIQNGNNQSIHSFGTNSLSKDMKITQSGNGSTVIVVNLK